MVRIDVRYLFDLAGGPKALIQLLEQHGQGRDLPYPTVQMWYQRDAIPAKWVASVLYVMVKEGTPLLTLLYDDEELVPDACPGC
jgi:hypothetical protein